MVAQMVKRLPAMRETQVSSLGREDPLEKEMATHPSTLAWKIPWTEEPGGLQSKGLQRVGHDWATSLSLYRPMWKMMLRERVRVLQTELNGTCVITGFLGTSHSLFCFVFTTLTEVRVGIKTTMQLLIHIVSQLYLTALLPESCPGTRKWWTLPLWVVVKDEWEVWRLIPRFPLLLLSGGWFGSPGKESDSWRGGP